MYYSIFGFLIIFVVHSALTLSRNEIKEACNKETGFEGDIEKLNYNSPDVTKEAKCAMACVFEKYGAADADGSLNKEKLKSLVEKEIKDEDLKKKYIKATDECDNSAKSNKCETAYEFVKCADLKSGIL